MLVAEPRALLLKLNAVCQRALQLAVGACVSARHYEVTVEHMLLALLDDLDSDVVRALEHYGADASTARSTLHHHIGSLRSGNAGKPLVSSHLYEWVQDAWILSSTELSEASVRS